MLNEALSKRYASAIYELASENNCAPAILDDLRLIQSTLQENPELKTALFSPSLGSDVKQNIARQLFTAHVKTLSLHFYMLLLKKGREAYLSDIIELYNNRLNDDNGVIEIKLEVASAIDPLLETLVTTNLVQMTGKRIKLDIEVHPELIAGAVFSAGEYFYDGSLRNQLAEIYKVLK
ncbi:MAG: ATP synthase F1 subunit delta [bacterium]|nr:ATP synthase F1 subunit delta [bacterium]